MGQAARTSDTFVIRCLADLSLHWNWNKQNMSLIIFLKNIKEDKKTVFFLESQSGNLKCPPLQLHRLLHTVGLHKKEGEGEEQKEKWIILGPLILIICLFVIWTNFIWPFFWIWCIVIRLLWKRFLHIFLQINIKWNSHQLGTLLYWPSWHFRLICNLPVDENPSNYSKRDHFHSKIFWREAKIGGELT